MKIAVTGKGGVGKTTVSAVLARLYAEEGKKVFAVDVDPDANLGLALGFPEEMLESMIPISKMRKMIEERTGADKSNTFYKVNPKVDDIPETYGKEYNGVRHRDDIVILDMEAGLEHMGRGTTEGMDQFIVVIEPGARSVQTYRNVKRLAEGLGVKAVKVIANKVRNEEDERFVRSKIPEEDFLGCIHYNAEVIEADREGASPYGFSRAATDEIRQIKETFDAMSR